MCVLQNRGTALSCAVYKATRAAKNVPISDAANGSRDHCFKKKKPKTAAESLLKPRFSQQRRPHPSDQLADLTADLEACDERDKQLDQNLSGT